VATSVATYYVSEIEIQKLHGHDRRAILPGGETVVYGVHGRIAEHYGVDLAVIDPRPSTLDHVVAATGACLLGTFTGMLDARGIPTDADSLRTTASGRVVLDNGVLVIDRIEVRYVLEVHYQQHDAAIRAHETHAEHCPVARSLKPAITIATFLELTTRQPESAPIA
jgi:uncharacterized OsmC-like protein